MRVREYKKKHLTCLYDMASTLGITRGTDTEFQSAWDEVTKNFSHDAQVIALGEISTFCFTHIQRATNNQLYEATIQRDKE